MAEEYIKWEDEFNTGDNAIDEQHQKIFQFINDLSSVILLEKDDVEVNAVLKGLTEYSIYHFELEEKMMIEKGYSKYDTHKREHEIFIERLQKLTEDLNKNKSITLRLLKFLKVWFSGHILHVDMKFIQSLS